MQQPVTQALADVPGDPTLVRSRSFRRALDDLAEGWRYRSLWGHLGLKDVKQSYRRSTLGPFWITFSLAVIAMAMGLLYSAVLGKPLAVYLPHVAVGLIVWQVIEGSINGGTNAFIRNAGLIKQLPAPISLHIYRLVWRELLQFGHNAVIWVALVFIFWPGMGSQLGLEVLLAIPALALVAINGMWFALVVGILATRFRDLPPLVNAAVRLGFFMTPIIWVYEDFAHGVGSARAQLAQLNPFMHFVEIVRQPLIGDDIVLRYWLVALGITAVGWPLALLVLRNYRSRVSYWV